MPFFCVLTILGILVSLGVAEWASHNRPSGNFYLLPTRGWEILLGVSCALILHRHQLKTSLFWANVISVIGLSAILYSVFVFDKSTPFPGFFTLIPTMGTVLIILFAGQGTLSHNLLSNRILVYVGLISYSLYLWHQPILAFLNYRVPAITEIQKTSSLLVAFVLAAASFHWIERPIRRYKGTVPVLPVTFATMTVFIAIGFALYFVDRWPIRFNKEELAVFEQYSHRGNYVIKNFDQHILREFDSDTDTPNILLIGDSYAQDMANIVVESGYIKCTETNSC